MNWGYKILFVYLGFVALILGMVSLCIVQKDIFLVDNEYYKEEINYQSKIDKIGTTARLKTPVHFQFKAGQLLVQYPVDARPAKGDLWLFRPSDARQDQHVPAHATDNGMQAISMATMKPGLWRVKLDWESQGHAYFCEEVLNVPQPH